MQVSVYLSSSVVFGSSRCTSLSSTCYGNINPTGEGFGQALGARSDSELLILTDTGVFSVWTGFDTDVNNGIGFVATYMTRKRTISISADCGYRSGTDYNFCGQRADPNLRITDWAGFTPHDTGVGIYTWARLGAWRGVAWRGVA